MQRIRGDSDTFIFLRDHTQIFSTTKYFSTSLYPTAVLFPDIATLDFLPHGRERQSRPQRGLIQFRLRPFARCLLPRVRQLNPTFFRSAAFFAAAPRRPGEITRCIKRAVTNYDTANRSGGKRARMGTRNELVSQG